MIADKARREAAIAEIREVCRKYDFVIEHEDSQGSFLLRPGFSESAFRWFADARVEVSP